jgi:hypothetical protein
MGQSNTSFLYNNQGQFNPFLAQSFAQSLSPLLFGSSPFQNYSNYGVGGFGSGYGVGNGIGSFGNQRSANPLFYNSLYAGGFPAASPYGSTVNYHNPMIYSGNRFGSNHFATGITTLGYGNGINNDPNMGSALTNFQSNGFPM